MVGEKVKKIIIMILLCGLCIVATFSKYTLELNAATIENQKDIEDLKVPDSKELPKCVAIAENTVRKYYEAEQTLSKVTFGNAFLYNSLEKYLDKRLENNRILLGKQSGDSDERSGKAINFKSDIQLDDVSYQSDGMLIKLSVNMEFRYEGCNEKSYFGNCVNVLMVKKDNSYLIADISFDEIIGNNTIVLGVNNWNIAVNSTEISKKMNDLKDNIN